MNTENREKPELEAGVTTESKISETRQSEGPLKVDRHGLPLVPQPSDNKDDPLNWSKALKLGILLQASLLTLMGIMGAAIINPAFVPLAAAFHITPVEASYELTVWTIFGAVVPLLLVPLANVYGRRPFYVLGNLLAAVTNLAAGHCTTWSGILATRALNGIGAGCATSLGPATVVDLFFLHERGLYMGAYTFCVTNAAHFAPLAGGFIAQNLGWSQCFTIPSYIQFGLFVITYFCFPETLYSRKVQDAPAESNKSAVPSYVDLLFFRTRGRQTGGRKVTLSSFAAPFVMMRYLCVMIPAVYYMTAFAYGSLLFAVTGSVVFRGLYGFNTAQTGMIISIPLVIGCILGECSAGWFTDWLVYRAARKDGGVRRPEPRVCISHANSTGWAANAVGMAIASFGLQVAGTVTYTYCTDCYKPQAAEISVVLAFIRLVYCALVPFYAVPLAEKIQYQYAWLTFACINIVFLLPMGFLRLYGERIRNTKWQSKPRYHPDI
ncbi:ornithine-oxo-acid transaminase [Apiospora arundinis]